MMIDKLLKRKKDGEADKVLREEPEKQPKIREKKRKKEKGEITRIAEAKNVKEVERINISFGQLLIKVQQYMSRKYAAELYDADKKAVMKRLIEQYMKDNNYFVPNMTLSGVSEKLYIEMAEYSILTEWLRRTDIEEINVNAWNDIQIIPAKEKPFKLANHFNSPQHAVDVIKRLLQNNKISFDASKPVVTGFLGTNIRITAVHTIVVGNDIGVSASIRIVNPAKITTEQFIENGTCTEEMYRFLSTAYNNGISQCFAGETGSGKTTIMADIMSHYPHNKRLITIEQSVREFNLIEKDEKGNVINNVLHFVTHETDDPNRDVTMQKLLTASLTMHPNSICVAEMKNEEAWEAQEAARTGHTVLTTTHASSVHGIYSRLATLCLQKYSEVPYDIIISLVAEAFPIGIYMKQLKDGSRRIMEIAECVYHGNGEYDTAPLYKYEVIDETEEEEGTRINGRFIKCGKPSEALQKRLKDNGVPVSALNSFLT